MASEIENEKKANKICNVCGCDVGSGDEDKTAHTVICYNKADISPYKTDKEYRICVVCYLKALGVKP